MRAFRLSLMFVLVIETQSLVCIENDCTVGSWQGWRPCLCGKGIRERIRAVSVKGSKCNGKCPQVSKETESW